MNVPDNLLYCDTHEWVRVEGKKAVIGITDYAQEQLGDITYVDLPAVGRALSAGADMGAVESVKAASELYCPISGKVTKVNADLDANPEIANSDPYGAGWIVRVKLSAQPEGLMDAAAYEEHCKNEQH